MPWKRMPRRREHEDTEISMEKGMSGVQRPQPPTSTPSFRPLTFETLPPSRLQRRRVICTALDARQKPALHLSAFLGATCRLAEKDASFARFFFPDKERGRVRSGRNERGIDQYSEDVCAGAWNRRFYFAFFITGERRVEVQVWSKRWTRRECVRRWFAM